MKQSLKLIFFLALYWAPNALVYANFTPKFINYNEGKAFYNQEIFHVLSDKNGLIWIATNDGIFNYNGKVFNHLHVAEGLTNNSVYKIHEDNKGRLWMITGNKELCFIENQQIHEYDFNEIITNELTDGSIIMGISYSETKGLLIVTNYDGYLAIDTTGNFIHHGSALEKKDCSENGIHIITVNHNTAISYEYNLGNKRCFPESDSITFHIERLTKENTLRKKETLKIKKKNWNFVNSVKYTCFLSSGEIAQILYESVYILENNNYQELNLQTSIIFLKEIDSILWIGTRKGIYTYNIITKQLIHQPYLRQYSISSVEKDMEGGYWFSTLEKGLFYTPNLLFRSYNTNKDSPISSAVRMDNSIVISYQNGQIDILKKDTLITIEPAQKGNYVVKGLTIDDKKNIYTSGAKIICTNQQKEKEIIDLKPHFGNNICSQKDYLFTASKRIFFCFKNRKLIFDKKLGYQIITGISILNNKVYVLCKSTTFCFYIEDDFYSIKIPQIKNCVKIWSQNDLIYGVTQKGEILKQKDNDTYSYSKPIIKNIHINDVFVKEDQIWLASNLGIVHMNIFDINNKTLINQAQGLASNNIIKIVDVDHDLIYATHNEIGHIPLPISQFKSKPIINNIQFKSNEQEYKQAPFHIILSEKDNEFIITPNCFTFRQSQEILYRYQLIGANKKTMVKSISEISYSGLKSGIYTFHIAATTNNIEYSDPILLQITIEQFFWKTRLFILSIFILGLLILFIIVRQVIKNIRKKERIRREMIELQSRALSSQMNPHFMFNFLNSLQLKIVKNETNEAIYYLTEFCELIRKNLDYFNENTITLLEEIKLTKNYLALEKIRFKEKFNFEINIDSNVLLDQFSIPPLILQPFIENSFVHGFKNKKETGIITIQINNYMKDAVQITIQDNGLGFDKKTKKKHKSIGINLIKQRLELHHLKNNISIHSILHEGTIVQLIIYK